MGHAVSFTVTQAANASGVTIHMGADCFDKIYVKVPTFSTGADVWVYASVDGGTSYARLNWGPGNTATSGYNPVILGTGSSGYLMPIPPGFQYYRMVLTATACAAAEYDVIAMRFGK